MGQRATDALNMINFTTGDGEILSGAVLQHGKLSIGRASWMTPAVRVLAAAGSDYPAGYAGGRQRKARTRRALGKATERD